MLHQSKSKKPNPMDVHVGARVRMRRMSLNISQEKLGDAVDLTFQQIQKYEKGTNRIGSSRLSEFSRILGVPVGFFFEGADAQLLSADPGYRDLGTEFMSSKEGQRIAAAFVRIKDHKVRARLARLMEAMVDPNAPEDELTEA